MNELTIKIKSTGDITPEVVTRIITAYDGGNGILSAKYGDGVEFTIEAKGGEEVIAKPKKKRAPRAKKIVEVIPSTTPIEEEVKAKVAEAIATPLTGIPKVDEIPVVSNENPLVSNPMLGNGGAPPVNIPNI